MKNWHQCNKFLGLMNDAREVWVELMTFQTILGSKLFVVMSSNNNGEPARARVPWFIQKIQGTKSLQFFVTVLNL